MAFNNSKKLRAENEEEIENIFREDDETDSDLDMKTVCEEIKLLKPYQFEPEGESNCGNTDDSDSSSEDNDSCPRPNRVGNKEWCQCKCCVVEKRAIDCLCCQEESAISEDKFEGLLTII